MKLPELEEILDERSLTIAADPMDVKAFTSWWFTCVLGEDEPNFSDSELLDSESSDESLDVGMAVALVDGESSPEAKEKAERIAKERQQETAMEEMRKEMESLKFALHHHGKKLREENLKPKEDSEPSEKPSTQIDTFESNQQEPENTLSPWARFKAYATESGFSHPVLISSNYVDFVMQRVLPVVYLVTIIAMFIKLSSQAEDFPAAAMQPSSECVERAFYESST